MNLVLQWCVRRWGVVLLLLIGCVGLAIWVQQGLFDPVAALEREVKRFHDEYNAGNCESSYQRAVQPYRDRTTVREHCSRIRVRLLTHGKFLSGSFTMLSVKKHINRVVVVAEYESVFENQVDTEYFSFTFKGLRGDGRLLVYQ
jgi:hypothetical protein